MTPDQIKRRDEKAKEFCKTWPQEIYHPNDLTLFFAKGYDQGFADAKEQMSYDVHTCHAECPRLMCVQRRASDEQKQIITDLRLDVARFLQLNAELTRKLEIAKAALQEFLDDVRLDNLILDDERIANVYRKTIKDARAALKDLE